MPSNVLPASLRKELLSGAKRAQTARGHNAIPKGLCRYSFTGDGQRYREALHPGARVRVRVRGARPASPASK